MKLIHSSYDSSVESRLERLISGRRRRRLQRRENTPAPGNTPPRQHPQESRLGPNVPRLRDPRAIPRVFFCLMRGTKKGVDLTIHP